MPLNVEELPRAGARPSFGTLRPDTGIPTAPGAPGDTGVSEPACRLCSGPPRVLQQPGQGLSSPPSEPGLRWELGPSGDRGSPSPESSIPSSAVLHLHTPDNRPQDTLTVGPGWRVRWGRALQRLRSASDMGPATKIHDWTMGPTGSLPPGAQLQKRLLETPGCRNADHTSQVSSS